MNPKSEIDPRLAEKLARLDVVPERSSANITKGRVAFLKEAQKMTGSVTAQPEGRHKEWKQYIPFFFTTTRKERPVMFNLLATLILTVALIFGGGGATLAAAQSSQPDQPLYSLKLWSEDVRLGLAAGPQAELQLMLQYTTRRAEEVQKMLQAGETPSEALLNHYQAQIEQAIQLAAGLNDEQAVKALEQVRTRLQSQQQLLIQPVSGTSPAVEAVHNNLQLMLQEQMQWAEQGIEDPAQLRNQIRSREQLRLRTQQSTTQTTPHGTQGTGEGNPWTTGTPMPGADKGPGYGATGMPTDMPAVTGTAQQNQHGMTITPQQGGTATPQPQPTQHQGGSATPQQDQPTQRQGGGNQQP